MLKKFLRQGVVWLPVVLWMALIFSLSSGTVPSASSEYWKDFAVKKTGHFLLFGILSLLTYRALIFNKVSKKYSALFSILLATFYGASDEYHQMFTQGRESTIRDVFIDACGAIFVVYFLYIIPSKVSKKVYSFMQSFYLT